MKTKLLLVLLIVLCLFSSCDNVNSKKEIEFSELSAASASYLENVPTLRYEQKLEDFDSLVSYIKQVSPIVHYNYQVRNIDFFKETTELRKSITPECSQAEFLIILQKVINLAQDGHTSIVPPYLADLVKDIWIPQGIEVYGYDSTAFEYIKDYNSFLDETFNTNLELEIIYSQGKYFNLLPFSFDNKEYPANMELIKCNGHKVQNLIKEMHEFISPVKWDFRNNIEYHHNFYKSSALYKNDSIKLSFLTSKGEKFDLMFSKLDSVKFLENKKRNIGSYNTNSSVFRSQYLDTLKAFYARIPSMQVEYADSLLNNFSRIKATNNIEDIIIDIRGNGGGGDYTYMRFLSKILKDTLKVDFVLGRNFSPINREYYSLNRDTIKNREEYTFDIDLKSKLDSLEMFYINIPGYPYIIPDKNQYDFNGNIYILQDRNIFSSSSNLSNLASSTNRLISVGETPDLLGGQQTITMILCLPNSKFLFRIEPQIDFSNTTNRKDIFQNNVDYFVPYTIDYLYKKATTEDDIFGEYFLVNNDPMIKKVLDLKGIKND